jgi:tungstate transport system ATP-binding protein
MNRAPAYSIRSLIHSYDGKVVLDIPYLEIPSGQVCVFAGPNGCGKTTLLSILAFLLIPSSGSVHLQGTEAVCERFRWIQRKITLVHQKPILFSTTVHKNIAYGLRMLGLPSKEIKNRVQAIMEETGLSDLAEKPARKLSGGEAQRAVLARALVLETPILLLDEPTNSLDDLSRPMLSELLRKANRRGATIIIATHDLNFISSLAHRIFKLEGGRISGSSDLQVRISP